MRKILCWLGVCQMTYCVNIIHFPSLSAEAHVNICSLILTASQIVFSVALLQWYSFLVLFIYLFTCVLIAWYNSCEELYENPISCLYRHLPTPGPPLHSGQLPTANFASQDASPNPCPSLARFHIGVVISIFLRKKVLMGRLPHIFFSLFFNLDKIGLATHFYNYFECIAFLNCSRVKDVQTSRVFVSVIVGIFG